MAKKSKFELAVIDKIRQMRAEKECSQDDLAIILGTTRGFIGQVESPNSSSKYNLDHLNRIALEWNCSPRLFIPQEAISEE